MSALNVIRKNPYVVAAAAYLALALPKLRYPGLHFDELLFANGALGGLDSTFIYKSLAGIPILLMPYIGALKAWLFGPIFEVFGVSILSIRLPMIILVAVSLVVLGRALQGLMGKKLALVVVGLLAIDPTIISLTRADSGPVAIQFALTIGALAFLLRYLQTLRPISLLGMWLCLGLGVFNKLNFIWIVNAMSASFALAYASKALKRLCSISRRRKILHSLLFVSGLGLTVTYYLLVSSRFNLFSHLDADRFDLTARLANVKASLFGMLNGGLMQEYWYGIEAGGIHNGLVLFVLAALLIGLAVALFKPSSSKRRVLIIFWLVLFIGTFAQLFVTRSAVWPWHYATLYPSLTILVVLLSRELMFWIGRRFKRAATLGALPVLVVAAMFLVASVSLILKHGESTKNPYWSPAIYELFDYTQTLDGQVVSLDWGIHTQLLTLSGDPDTYKENAFFINRDPLPSTAREQFMADFASADSGSRYFVLHSERATLFPSARKNFFELIGKPHSTQLIHTIGDEHGPLFEIYELES